MTSPVSAGVLYITDHHHLSIALLHAFLPYDVPMVHRLLFMCVNYDMSDQSQEAFWATLRAQNLVWLFDNRGNPIPEEEIPHSVKYLEDDPYRTLALWAREAKAIVKCGTKSANKNFPQCDDGKVVAKPVRIEMREWRHRVGVSVFLVQRHEARPALVGGYYSENPAWLRGLWCRGSQ